MIPMIEKCFYCNRMRRYLPNVGWTPWKNSIDNSNGDKQYGALCPSPSCAKAHREYVDSTYAKRRTPSRENA